MQHVPFDENADLVLHAADLVVYESLLEQQSFPGILRKAMCFGKPVIAPDLSMIRKYVCFEMIHSLYISMNVYT